MRYIWYNKLSGVDTFLPITVCARFSLLSQSEFSKFPLKLRDLAIHVSLVSHNPRLYHPWPLPRRVGLRESSSGLSKFMKISAVCYVYVYIVSKFSVQTCASLPCPTVIHNHVNLYAGISLSRWLLSMHARVYHSVLATILCMWISY